MIPHYPAWPVDAHVHFHTFSRVGPTLDAAAGHFRAVSGLRSGFIGAILLAQTQGETVFDELCRVAMVGGWTFSAATREPETLLADRGGLTVAVVCGRQVRSAGGLEVLALGTRQSFSDGLSFENTVRTVCDSTALAVLPWGFGKWWGPKGARVRSAAEAIGPQRMFLGDNGNRLEMLARPRLMRELDARGYRILPGSDPLPLPEGWRSAGRCGFAVEVVPDPRAPWSSVRGIIEERRWSPTPYGRAASSLQFIFDQTAMQLRRRSEKSGKS